MAINCFTCKKDTHTSEPVLLKRYNGMKFYIMGICSECLKTKTGFLTRDVIRRLPDEVRNMQEKWSNMKYIELNGKMVELYPILDPLINGGQ